MNGTVVTRIHNIRKYLQPRIDLLLYENHYCLLPEFHFLINKCSHIKHACKRCLTAVSSIDILYQHMEKWIKQQPTKISFSWKDQSKFEDNHMKIQYHSPSEYMQLVKVLTNLKLFQITIKYHLNKLHLLYNII